MARRPETKLKEKETMQSLWRSAPLEKCKVFSGWSTEKKWEAAKRFGVCYRCLNDDHLGNQCPKSKACDATGCKKTHHPLLHESQPRQESKVPSTKGDTKGQTTTLNTIERHEERIIALRTVPAILKHGKRRLLVKCFLDEGSDTTYVNEDVIETLGISTQKDHQRDKRSEGTTYGCYS